MKRLHYSVMGLVALGFYSLTYALFLFPVLPPGIAVFVYYGAYLTAAILGEVWAILFWWTRRDRLSLSALVVVSVLIALAAAETVTDFLS